jgi:hypothetical protein
LLRSVPKQDGVVKILRGLLKKVLLHQALVLGCDPNGGLPKVFFLLKIIFLCF